MKLAVVLTDANQAEKVEIAAAAWRKLYPDAVIVHATNTASAKAPSADVLVDADSPNPGYYAPEGVLHGHHANLNAGVREALKFEGWDYLITTCGDIKPRAPHLLVDRFRRGVEPHDRAGIIGVCNAPWDKPELVNWTCYQRVLRVQDDVLVMNRGGANGHFPLSVYPCEPYWSEVSFRGNIRKCEAYWGLIEDMARAWRPRWYEKWGFEAI